MDPLSGCVPRSWLPHWRQLHLAVNPPHVDRSRLQKRRSFVPPACSILFFIFFWHPGLHSILAELLTMVRSQSRKTKTATAAAEGEPYRSKIKMNKKPTNFQRQFALLLSVHPVKQAYQVLELHWRPYCFPGGEHSRGKNLLIVVSWLRVFC